MKVFFGIVFGLCMVVLNYGWIPFTVNFFYQAFVEHGGVWQPLWVNFAGYMATMIIAFLIMIVTGGLLAIKK